MTVKPVYDGEESLAEVVEWVAEPDDIKERAERLVEALNGSLSFLLLITQTFQPQFSFKETLAQGELIVRTHPYGRWGFTSVTKLAKEIERYSDSSPVLPQYRLTQLMASLDDTYGPDGVYIKAMVEGRNILPEKINHRLLELGGFYVGETSN
jgi:hypothetical protein